jgi:hypothetical protein
MSEQATKRGGGLALNEELAWKNKRRGNCVLIHRGLERRVGVWGGSIAPRPAQNSARQTAASMKKGTMRPWCGVAGTCVEDASRNHSSAHARASGGGSDGSMQCGGSE